jgi:hypothetical protein
MTQTDSTMLPDLSVVIVTPDDYRTIRRTVGHLHAANAPLVVMAEEHAFPAAEWAARWSVPTARMARTPRLRRRLDRSCAMPIRRPL